MKLNVTSSIIKSPSLENHHLCTHLVIEAGDRWMVVNCTTEEWDMKPVERFDRERCAWYGQWKADFYKAGCQQPELSLGLGDTELESASPETKEYGIEIFGMETLSEESAITQVVNTVLWRLLQSPNHPHTGAVVLKDRVEWAEWLMRSGIQHGKKEGDFKVSRFFKGSAVERVYNFGAGKGLSVKSSLVTYELGHNRRETRMFYTGDHLYLTADDFSADPERYVDSLKSTQGVRAVLNKNMSNLALQTVNDIIRILDTYGYSTDLINRFIIETNEVTEKHNAVQSSMSSNMHQNPMIYGGANPLFGNQDQLQQHAMLTGCGASPMPTGVYNPQPSKNNIYAPETKNKTLERLDRNFYL